MKNYVEEEFIPSKSERKLANLFRMAPELRQNKELQYQIIALAKEMLLEETEEWNQLRKNTLQSVIKVHQKAKACKGAAARDRKYAQFRVKFAEIQKEYFVKAFQNKQNLTANSFVNWFIMNKSQETPIPYVKQNQKNKLRQLAQKNNREFKKLLPGKS